MVNINHESVPLNVHILFQICTLSHFISHKHKIPYWLSVWFTRKPKQTKIIIYYYGAIYPGTFQFVPDCKLCLGVYV